MRSPVALKTAAYMALGLSLIVLTAGGAGAREQQLAGMRLGQHAINLLDVYGQPDGIVVGQGPEFGAASAAQMPGGAPGMGGPGGPTPAMFGPPSAGMMGGAGAPPPPGMAGPAGGAMPGPGNFGPGVPGAPGMPGAPGAAGGAAAAVQASPFPEWALAVWVEMKPGQVEWIYNKGPVVLGFVLDRDGYIDSIALVGEDCNYARTAMWRPHQYVKLGDDFKRVMYRYGYPDESITFESTGPGDAAPGQGSVTVTFAGNSHVFSHDVIVRYTETNNVAFTLHDLKVTRIQIWR